MKYRQNRLYGVAVFALFGVIFGAISAFGAEYYVDSSAGDDSAAGTTPQRAWKTLDRVTTAALEPGDSVLFKRGEIWRGALNARNGKEGKPIFYGAYGEGNKPTFLVSVDLTDPDAWVAPSDPNSNIWKTRPDRVLESEKIAGVAENGLRIWTEQEAKARLEKVENGDSGAAIWRLAVEKSGTGSSQLQLIGPNIALERLRPVSMKFRFKSSVPFTLKNVSLNKNGSPWTRYADSVPKEVKIGTDWTEVEYRFVPNADDPNGRLSFFVGGIVPDGAVFEIEPLETERLTVDSLGLSVDVGNIILTPKGKLPADPAARFLDDTNRFAAFKRWSPEQLKAQDDFWYDAETKSVWYYSQTPPAERFDEIEAALKIHAIRVSEYVVLDQIAAGFGAAHGVAGYQSKGCVITGCDFFWLGGGDHSAGYANPTRFGNGVEFWSVGEDHLVENCRFWQIYDVAMSIQGPEKTIYRNIVWRGNQVSKCEQSFELWLTHPESEIRGNIFENNRCYDAGFGWSHEQRPNKNGTHLLGYNLQSKVIDFKMRNNVFCNGRNALIMFWNGRIGEFDLDNNLWWQPARDGVAGIDQPVFQWALAGDKKTVGYEEYRQITGNDKNSRFEEPDEINAEINTKQNADAAKE